MQYIVDNCLMIAICYNNIVWLKFSMIMPYICK